MALPQPTTSHTERNGRRTLGASLAVGAVIVGLAALFPAVETAPQDAAPFTFAPLAAAPTLGEIVPGWRDTLVVVAGVGGSDDRRAMAWGASDAIATGGASFEALAVAFDASGDWIAATSDEGELVLRRATGQAVALLAEAVTGFAWHGEQPGRLAWTTSDERTTTLEVGSGDMEVAERGPGRLLAWASGGHVYEPAVGTARVVPAGGAALDVDGDFVGRVSGGFVFRRVGADPGRSALFLVTPDARATARLDIVGGDGRTRWVLPNPVRAGVSAAVVEKTTAGGVSSLEVCIVDPGGDVLQVLGPATRHPAMVWTPDGRWIVVVGDDGAEPRLLFHDLDTGATTAVVLTADVLGLQPGEEVVQVAALGVRAGG